MRSKKEIVRRKELSRMHAKLWKLFRALHGPHSWIPSDVSTALETYRTRARGRRESLSFPSTFYFLSSLKRRTFLTLLRKYRFCYTKNIVNIKCTNNYLFPFDYNYSNKCEVDFSFLWKYIIFNIFQFLLFKYFIYRILFIVSNVKYIAQRDL